MKPDFFTANRRRAIEKLQGGLLVVTGYTQMQRSNDTAFKFEQEANFWYLTGISHPDWWLIIDGAQAKSWLVGPDVNDTHALFDGSLAHDEAGKISGIGDIITRCEGLALLRREARKHPLVYTVDQPQYHDHFGFTLNPSARDMRETLATIFADVHDFRAKLAKLRAIKQPEEIVMLQTAIDLTIASFQSIHEDLKSYKYEYQVEADFSHDFRHKGSMGHAYDPIIASGGNACTLHYVDNNSVLKKGALLLCDVGARVGGYAADITRTYAYGAATKRQIAVHAAVRRAQAAIIQLITPDLPVEDYQRQVDDIMKAEVFGLGLMKSLDDNDAYRRYFPHAISHGLGIDVHDSLGAPRTLQPGMVLTVEPGIYIPEENIGIRIEDDILVTANGHRNLSSKLSTDL